MAVDGLRKMKFDVWNIETDVPGEELQSKAPAARRSVGIAVPGSADCVRTRANGPISFGRS